MHEAEAVVDVVLSSIRSLLMSADPEVRLELRDFGVFEVKMCKAKPLARNPRTGTLVFVPCRRKSHFKPGKILKSFFAEPLSPEAETVLNQRDGDSRSDPGMKRHVPSLNTN